MSGPSALARWRAAEGLSSRHAARVLRVSPEFYARLERGEGECGPALALDIAARTRMAVLPADLPGCATDAAAPDVAAPETSASKSSARVGEDGRADAGGAVAPEPPPPAIERFIVTRLGGGFIELQAAEVTNRGFLLDASAAVVLAHRLILAAGA